MGLSELRRRVGDDGDAASTESAPDTFVAVVALLAGLATAWSLDGGEGRWAELLLAGAAVAAAYTVARRAAWAVAVAAGVGYLALELAYGRLDRDRYWLHVLYLTAIGAATLAAAYLRHARELREAGLTRAVTHVESEHERASLQTLLAGRRHLTSLELELERSRRHNHRLALLHVRLDDADEILSRWGEPALRQALRCVAEVLGEHARATDVAFQTGPVDYALILPETPGEGARTLAERVRLALASRPVELDPGQRVDLSVSVGSASFPDDATTNEQLARAADRALERALELGGNRTVLHSVPAGAPAGWGVGVTEPSD